MIRYCPSYQAHTAQKPPTSSECLLVLPRTTFSISGWMCSNLHMEGPQQFGGRTVREHGPPQESTRSGEKVRENEKTYPRPIVKTKLIYGNGFRFFRRSRGRIYTEESVSAYLMTSEQKCRNSVEEILPLALY
jgi:hypothetical protein